MHPLVVSIAALRLVSLAVAAGAPADPVVLVLREQAEALAPLMRTPLARRFLAATATLPPPPARTLQHDPVGNAWYGESEARLLPDSIRVRLQPDSVDGRFYYQTRYGTPLNYARAIELAARDGLGSLEGRRVLDFGYGRIGHLRLLASLGATVVGVEVDPTLRALYTEPGDQGPVPGGGRIRLVGGSFPGDAAIRDQVGGEYDLVLSKNTLKGGHEPEERARQSQVIHLGVDDSVFVREVYQRLRPGGRLLIYNLASPLGNGRCPFPESMLRSAGFDVGTYDRDDSPDARAMLRALGRDEKDLESTTALYTLARRPQRSRESPRAPRSPHLPPGRWAGSRPASRTD